MRHHHRYRLDVVVGGLPITVALAFTVGARAQDKGISGTEATDDTTIEADPAADGEIDSRQLDDGVFMEALEPEADDFETVVRGERPRREVTRHRITSTEINRIPGIHGDAVLAIQTLPGVGKPPALLGELYIRGSAGSDSVCLIDGLYVPTVFHFGAVNAVINSDLIDTVAYYPGNFSVRYGRGIGGVVDIEIRTPGTERFHGYVDVDIWDVSVLAEGPVSDRWSVAASFRRSYIDAILKGTGLLENQLRFTAAPRYYDFQAIADYHPSRRNHLRLLFLGSDDKVRFSDDLFDGTFDISTQIHTRSHLYQAELQWRHRFHRRLSNELAVGVGTFGAKGAAHTAWRTTRAFPVHLRDELTLVLSPELLLRLGTDSGFGWYEERLEQRYLQVPVTDIHKRFEAHPALYAELELLAIPNTQLVYGFRADYHSVIEDWSVDGRFSVRHTPTPLTAFKAGFGLFQQPPQMYQLSRSTDPGGLDPAAAVHYSAGIEQRVPGLEHLAFGMEGFYKDIRRLLTFHPGSGDFQNSGMGRAFGLELQITHRQWRHFFGWVSYTLMRSQLFPDESYRPRAFDRDQTHVLTLVAGVSVKWGIDLGLRFRLASGFPYTPVVGVQFIDTFHGGNTGILGEENASRMPLFHQLDLRIDKTWKRKTVTVSLYLDVQNVYNRQNPVFYLYSADYTQKKAVYDLPVLPSLGLRLEH